MGGLGEKQTSIKLTDCYPRYPANSVRWTVFIPSFKIITLCPFCFYPLKKGKPQTRIDFSMCAVELVDIRLAF